MALSFTEGSIGGDIETIDLEAVGEILWPAQGAAPGRRTGSSAAAVP